MEYIDIYTLTHSRNKETIEQFLSEYTDRHAIEDLKDTELNILPKGMTRDDITHPYDYTWVQAKTVTSSIEIGLSETGICFSLYLLSNQPATNNVIITFTQDDKLILGLSILRYKDESGELANDELAIKLRDTIQANYNGTKSYFGVEAPPVDNEQQFDKAIKEWSNYNFSTNP